MPLIEQPTTCRLLKYQSRILLIGFTLLLVTSDYWFPDTPRRHLLVYVTVTGSLTSLLLVVLRTAFSKFGAVVVILYMMFLATVPLVFWYVGHRLGSAVILASAVFFLSANLEAYWLTSSCSRSSDVSE